MSDSDGTLAKVTYFPGVARPSEPADVAPASSPASPPPPRDEDGWYVDPAATTDTGNVAPLRRTARVPELVESASESASPSDPDESGPVVEVSPALAKMRALIADAEKKAATLAAMTPEAPGRQRRAVTQKFVAEEPDDEDSPPSREELLARAERVSMSALTRKGMSSWELAERLRAQDLDEDIVAHEIERLERVGLLDDLDLAETLVRTLQERKGLGRSGITAELRRRHVDPGAIEEALGALDTDDESARALEIAVKRAPQLRSLDSTTAQRRLSAFLMRKGYSSTAISFAVAGALKGTSGPRFR
jgi:regulatory protein